MSLTKCEMQMPHTAISEKFEASRVPSGHGFPRHDQEPAARRHVARQDLCCFASFGAGVTDLDTLQGISYRPARFCLCEAHI